MKYIITLVFCVISLQSFAEYNSNYDASMKEFAASAQSARERLQDMLDNNN